MHDKEMASRTRPRITPQTQIFSYGTGPSRLARSPRPGPCLDTRLDLTIQPLIQDISSQIIDSSPCFSERFRDFSCMKFPFKTKQKVLSHVNSFWSDIYKKCQKWF